MVHWNTARLYNCKNVIYKPVETLLSATNSIDIEEFRKKAFYPEVPLLLSRDANTVENTSHYPSIPAAKKWFIKSVSASGKASVILSREYLNPYASTILPYEIMGPSHKSLFDLLVAEQEANNLTESTEKFHQFKAPLALILNCRIKGLYISQASLTDLPSQLQHDFSTPIVVAKAGKGDVYNTNIWIGNPPTYTPLHKDPNPNFFMQLSGMKRVRLFEPDVGLKIFKRARKNIGEVEHSGVFRGIEMMEGAERKELEKVVWDSVSDFSGNGMEAIVKSGDSLFIPKGWWHSIKGSQEAEQDEVVASVNWWFR